jgi:RNA polymerase sigma-70 factor (ECF subfamily)
LPAPGDGLDSEILESTLIRHEENGMIHALIEELLHLFREVLVLRDVEDMFYREITDITGVPASLAMPHLVRALGNGTQMRLSEEMLP